MDSWVIEHAIYESDITQGEALEGGCGPIARAIQRVFGGDFVVVMDSDGNPRHAAVRINGTLYDGTGRTQAESLVSLFTDAETRDEPRVADCELVQVKSRLTPFRNNPPRTEELVDCFNESVDNLE